MTVARSKVRGDPLLSAEWNDILRRIQRLESLLQRRLSEASQVAPSAVPFAYQSSDGDVIVGREIDQGFITDVDTYIAKPYLHRPSITVRGLHTYVYTNDFERTDTLGVTVETQVLVPDYLFLDVIYAVRCGRFSGVTYDPLGGANEAPVQWLQLNVEGRAWAKKFGT